MIVASMIHSSAYAMDKFRPNHSSEDGGKPARDTQPRGDFYLNSAAMISLGDPFAVRLMSDRDAGLIGIAAAPLKAKTSFELKMKYGADSPGRVFRATEFCRSLALQFKRTILFREPKVENGVLILNIHTTIFAPKRAIPFRRQLQDAGYGKARIDEILGIEEADEIEDEDGEAGEVD